MRKDKFKVFLIIEGLNVLVRTPVLSFISKNTEEAKLYFEEYIKKLKTATYSLYEIMEITKDELKEKRVFITSSLNIETRQVSIVQEMNRIKAAKKETWLDKQLEILFDARRVDNVKEKIS